MYWNRSAADIAAAWQAEIESKFETGSTALLHAGAPDTLLTSATTLIGLQHSTVQRTDVATPLLLAGGNSALWLGLLLAPQLSSSPHAPAPTVIYGGADATTYLAMMGMNAAGVTTARMTTAQPTQPLGLGAHLAPRLQPGVATPWEMLPLLEAGEQPLPANAAGRVARDPADDWIAWGVMLLAFCLVLSALLI
jgi:hypothetical protein